MPTVGIRTIDFCGRGSLSARCSAHVSWRCCTHVAALVRRSRRAFLVRSWPVVMACPNRSWPVVMACPNRSWPVVMACPNPSLRCG
jgi:hypothetical protein